MSDLQRTRASAQQARERVWPDLERALRDDRPIDGTVLEANLTRVAVDVAGARALLPRSEAPLDWLLAGPGHGAPWRGYVASLNGSTIGLSSFAAAQRVERDRTRKQQLAPLVPGAQTSGRVVFVERGALVSLGNGLIWGFVPPDALSAPEGQLLAPGRVLDFRILERGAKGDREVHLCLWPSHANSQVGQAA